jgi:uncharacterized protein with PIN domain
MDDAAAPGAGVGLHDPRFAVDAMLGRLARWLRVLGYDAWYHAQVPDDELVDLAWRDDRILLTRDRHLLRELRPVRALEIRQDAPLAQLRDVVETLALAPPRELFTRCMLDNAPLVVVPDALAWPQLPEGVRGVASPVWQCPECGRFYWNGSHVRRMRHALERALPGWLDASPP